MVYNDDDIMVADDDRVNHSRSTDGSLLHSLCTGVAVMSFGHSVVGSMTSLDRIAVGSVTSSDHIAVGFVTSNDHIAVGSVTSSGHLAMDSATSKGSSSGLGKEKPDHET